MSIRMLFMLLSFVFILHGTTAAPIQIISFISKTNFSNYQTFQTTVHNVDDVAPALTNATNIAFQQAHIILSEYSDLLRIIAIPVGLIITFFGYFLLGPVLFLATFLTGGGVCFIAVRAALGTDTPAAAWLSIIAMILGGALLGFLALRALSVGIFAIGAALGVVLAATFKTTLITKAYPKNPQLAFIITAVIAGIILGTLALCLQKQMVIFSTSYAGSCGFTFGIGHLAGHFPTEKDLINVTSTKISPWLIFYVIMMVFVGSLGMAFQFWLAKNKKMADNSIERRRRRRNRSRYYNADDWSEGDDDWIEDETFTERVPLPRRKWDAKQKKDTHLYKPVNSTNNNQEEVNQNEMKTTRRNLNKAENELEELSSTEDADIENPYISSRTNTNVENSMNEKTLNNKLKNDTSNKNHSSSAMFVDIPLSTLDRH